MGLVGRQRIKLIAGTTVFVLGLAYAYDHVTNEITRNSSLVRQTLENLERNKACRLVTGGNCNRILSRFHGTIAQRKGVADFDFDVQCSNGQFTVAIQASRDGLNWRTRQLTVLRNGQELVIERGQT